jgi:biotin carboxyl carrier protein
LRTAVIPEGAVAEGVDRLAVAGAYGSVSISPARSFTAEGEYVLCGDVVAHVADGAECVPVKATADAWVISYLVSDGERVEPGTPIAHLRLA